MSTGSVDHGRRPPLGQRAWALVGLYGLCCGAALLFIGVYTAVWGFQPTPRHIGGTFRLQDGNGHLVTDRSWPGRYLLIYFGYTSCPDACPLALSHIAGALDAMGPAASRIQPLFVTIDPARDTPAALRRYTALFSPRILGLTGTAAELRRVWSEYGVSIRSHREPDGFVVFDHSHAVDLMAPDGRFVGWLDGSEEAGPMAHDLAAVVTPSD